MYATANSVAVPALLPDGSVAPESLSELLENLPADALDDERRAVAGDEPEPDARALTDEPDPPEPTGSGKSGEPVIDSGPEIPAPQANGNGHSDQRAEHATEEVHQ